MIDPNLIREARHAADAYDEISKRVSYARRQLFLAMLESLLTDPEVTVTGIALELDADPEELPSNMGHEIMQWLMYRLYKERQGD